MSLKYTDSEVKKYHPLCEKALNEALKNLNLDVFYEVGHHESINKLEVDFVIKNKNTQKYLCMIEVKRTPEDLNSIRYQNQAQTYVREASEALEKSYYILTNLEFMYTFKYDDSRKRTVQQILNPGLIQIGLFKENEEKEFFKLLVRKFEEVILSFVNEKTSYFLTFDTFEKYVEKVKDNKLKLKQVLIILLYEYIRGALGNYRNNYSLLKDVRKFGNDIEEICREASRVNFKEIFKVDSEEYYMKAPIVKNSLKEEIYNLGKQIISGDMISNILHTIMCDGKEKEGKVPTDPELARILGYLVHDVHGNISQDELICDIAAGSGSLISSGVDIFKIKPTQIWANDYDCNLLELLSLRLGLKYPQIISKSNSPKITCKNIIDLNPKECSDIKVMLLNPPYIAGIDCIHEKKEIIKRVEELSGKEANFKNGQIGMEALFLELVLNLVPKDATVGCILPKQYINSMGSDAVKFRKFLITDFGLEKIFYYPSTDLFEKVVKDTCIFIGNRSSSVEDIKLISSFIKIADIDSDELIRNLERVELFKNEFGEIIPGVEAIKISKQKMIDNCTTGWNDIISSENLEAEKFISKNFVNNKNFYKIKELKLTLKRGTVGNSGASELLFIDMNSPNLALRKIYEKIRIDKAVIALKKATESNDILIKKTKCVFCDFGENSQNMKEILNEYMQVTAKTNKSKQTKKAKTFLELKQILEKSKQNITPKNSILIPRAIRKTGRIFMLEDNGYVSTNFLILEARSKDEGRIISSWMSTIMFQLLCEFMAKDNEGMRKLEKIQIEELCIYKYNLLEKKKKDEILGMFERIEFLELTNPKIREIDKIWGDIIFGENSEEKIEESRRLLKFLARKRNSKNLE